MRLSAQSARVSDDIRAALTSLGRGNTVVGGVALIGVRVPGTERSVDALVVLPRGVIVVVAVDLPDPAMRLDAPLTGQWKADGWPLVRTGEAVNPAVEAVAGADGLLDALRPVLPGGLATGTVIAVGPYVETVDAPPAELNGTTRVLYPTPTSMLAATVSLASSDRPCTVDEVGAILRLFAPDARPPSAAALAAEGFAGATPPEPAPEHPLAIATVTVPAEHPGAPPAPAQPAPPREEPLPAPVPQAPTASPSAGYPAARAHVFGSPAPAGAPRPAAAPVRAVPRRPVTVRWVPIAAGVLLLGVLVLAIVLATGAEDTDEAPAATGAPPPAPAAPTSAPIDGITFTERAMGSDPTCAPHATGDLQADLEATDCGTLRRGSFETEVAGKRIAVSVAVATFEDAAAAERFKAAADTPGTGSIADLATATGRWPSAPPAFETTAYASSTANGSVRLVQACLIGGPSTPDDPDLVRAAAAGLRIPVAD
ncbi:hypothetical protein [Amycolatopsis antarctica]|uniref:hypothetical protein n=1 Tax=Amycolatopsis antarctica TaxID=1854586 RepID=UPI0030B8281F